MERVNIAKVLIRRADGKYLILRSSKWEERPDRSEKPDLPGGLVEAGETHEVGAVREVQEEAGISLRADQLDLVHAGSHIWKEKEAINRLIYMADVDDPTVVLSWEHDDFWWMSKDELLALDIREPYKNIFNYLDTIGVLR